MNQFPAALVAFLLSTVVLHAAGTGKDFNLADGAQSDGEWQRLYGGDPGEGFRPLAKLNVKEADVPEWFVVDFEVEAGPLGERSVYAVEIKSRDKDYYYRQLRVFRPEDVVGGKFRAAFVTPGRGLPLQLTVGLQGEGDLKVRDLKFLRETAVLQEAAETPVVPVDPPFEPFGMCQHMARVGEHEWFESDEEIVEGLDRMGEAGVQWVRTGSGFGSLFPKAPGEIDAEHWRRVQLVDEGAIARGLRLFVQVAGVPKWATLEGEFEPWWGAPPEIEPWKDYIRFIAEHYKGKTRYFEIGNEADWEFFLGTPEQFAERFIEAAKIIREVIPDARIMGPGLAGDGANATWGPKNEPYFLEKILAAGVGEYLNIPTLHFYEENVPAAIDKINRFCDTLDRHGLADRPVWITEAGYFYSSQSQPGFRERQAAFLRDMFQTVVRHPRVEKVFWWHLGGYPHAEPQREGGRDLPYLGGLIDHERKPYPALQTMAGMDKAPPREVVPSLRRFAPGQ